jgi:predicted pyridoxine 5'-phosphate oxidase superfamily flavin-nucleotide-binding protein
MEARPFHRGEREAQRLAGLGVLPGGAGIRDFMPDQHRDFFARLPFLAAAALEADGAPAATLLAGRPGFIQSPDPHRLEIAGEAPRDPAAERLLPGASVGLLGIELATRRRNRANGRILGRGPDGLVVEVAQSFGNCPQHIRPRQVRVAPAGAAELEIFEGLDARARAVAAAADTFFVATSSGAGVVNGGVDISHRGGAPGFVRVEGEVLTIPDYAGNRFYNTLGNLLLDPRCALLFIDFATGVITQLQGRAELLWDLDAEHGGAAGAERSWRVVVERGWRRRSGVTASLAA